ncbi:MAG: amidohydrolase family protein [Gammaproteobacteria bacterium]
MHALKEDILDPDLEICDPHHHLWHYPQNRYGAEEILADLTDGHQVTSTVFIECLSKYKADGPEHLKPVGETEFVVSEAKRAAVLNPDINMSAAIVGFVDLTLETALVEEALEGHIEASEGRYRGVRHAVAYDPHLGPSHTHPAAGLMLTDSYINGCKILQRRGLVMDAWQYHPQLSELKQLAMRVSDLPIILDHLGGVIGIENWVGRHDEIFPEWQKQIRELAACDNIVMKLGGMAMKVNGFDWHHGTSASSAEMAEVYAPWYHHAIDAFGVERCMFESNFPVDRVSCSYRTLWNMLKRLASGCSDDEKKLLFRDNARKVYALDR